MKRHPKKYKLEKARVKQVSEPAVAYEREAKKEVVFPNKAKDLQFHIFNSFEEMNEFDIKEMAKSTPRQRFKNVTYLLQQRYAEELKKPMDDVTLHFEIKNNLAKAQRKKK